MENSNPSTDFSEASHFIFFRPATDHDLSQIQDLESAGYPPDEAASPQMLQYRLENAPEFFLVAVQIDAITGFVCGTLAGAGRLKHESMSNHDPEGTVLCIHSVCVADSKCRKGIASRLLKAYLMFVEQTSPQVEAVHLLCKEALVPLYAKAGFCSLGPSEVVHGQEAWLEMSLAFNREQ